MGFERSQVIEAFLCCDRNEALTVNFLLDSMNRDDGPSGGNNAGDNAGGNN